MKLKSRFSTAGFVEISADETKATIFDTDIKEAEAMIDNLAGVIEDLANLLNRSVSIIINND